VRPHKPQEPETYNRPPQPQFHHQSEELALAGQSCWWPAARPASRWRQGFQWVLAAGHTVQAEVCRRPGSPVGGSAPWGEQHCLPAPPPSPAVSSASKAEQESQASHRRSLCRQCTSGCGRPHHSSLPPLIVGHPRDAAVAASRRRRRSALAGTAPAKRHAALPPAKGSPNSGVPSATSARGPFAEALARRGSAVAAASH